MSSLSSATKSFRPFEIAKMNATNTRCSRRAFLGAVALVPVVPADPVRSVVKVPMPFGPPEVFQVAKGTCHVSFGSWVVGSVSVDEGTITLNWEDA